MNNKLADLLAEIADLAVIIGQNQKRFAYRTASRNIKNWPGEITAENAPQIPGVGKSISAVIGEFIKTGKISLLEEWRADPRIVAYKIFSKMVGVGPATITKWRAGGICTIQDLKRAVADKTIVLNKMQKYGLLYYEDLASRIPRDEITQISNLIKTMFSADIDLEVVGSYRRLAATSGDIDILITNKKSHTAPALDQFVEALQTKPWFVDILSSGPERLTFIIKSPISNKVRQVDILSIVATSYVAALNYFTGPWEHNTVLRGKAKTMGMKLNQAGLFKGTKSIPLKTEADLYAALQMEYVEPQNR